MFRPLLRISIARGFKRPDQPVDLGNILLRQVENSAILLDPVGTRRARDGDEDGAPVTLRQLPNPIDRQLRITDAILVRNALDVLHQLQIPSEVLRVEPGEQMSEVVGGQVLDALELSREEAAAER